jgi:hypothetical protein
VRCNLCRLPKPVSGFWRTKAVRGWRMRPAQRRLAGRSVGCLIRKEPERTTIASPGTRHFARLAQILRFPQTCPPERRLCIRLRMKAGVEGPLSAEFNSEFLGLLRTIAHKLHPRLGYKGPSTALTASLREAFTPLRMTIKMPSPMLCCC